MANKPKLTSVKRALHSGLVSSLNLFAAVYDFTDSKKTWDAIYGSEPIHPAQVRRVVALAFMNIVASWEEFVQSTGSPCVCIDPWKFADRVLNAFLADPRLITISESFPLASVSAVPSHAISSPSRPAGGERSR
jgi:hypothetical protein